VEYEEITSLYRPKFISVHAYVHKFASFLSVRQVGRWVLAVTSYGPILVVCTDKPPLVPTAHRAVTQQQRTTWDRQRVDGRAGDNAVDADVQGAGVQLRGRLRSAADTDWRARRSRHLSLELTAKDTTGVRHAAAPDVRTPVVRLTWSCASPFTHRCVVKFWTVAILNAVDVQRASASDSFSRFLVLYKFVSNCMYVCMYVHVFFVVFIVIIVKKT